MSAGLNVAMTALLVLVAAAAVCKSAPLADNSEEVLDDGVKKNSTVAAAVAIRKPALTYAAGPNQLTLLMDQGAFRSLLAQLSPFLCFFFCALRANNSERKMLAS